MRVENLLPACKNIGTTHITNVCYRLHPVEWNIGGAAGLLAALDIERAAVMGHSMGGFVAQALVLSRPELVGRLIL